MPAILTDPKEKVLDLIHKLESGPVYFTTGESIFDNENTSYREVKLVDGWEYDLDSRYLYVHCYQDYKDYQFHWDDEGGIS